MAWKRNATSSSTCGKRSNTLVATQADARKEITQMAPTSMAGLRSAAMRDAESPFQPAGRRGRALFDLTVGGDQPVLTISTHAHNDTLPVTRRPLAYMT